MSRGGLRGCCGSGNSLSSKAAQIIPVIAAGYFREKVTIQRPVQNLPDGQGGVYEQWADLAIVWASISTISESATGNIEKFEEMQIKYQQHFSVMLRYGAPLDTSYRILYTGPTNITQILQIIAVVNVDTVNWQTQLYVREGGNIG